MFVLFFGINAAHAQDVNPKKDAEEIAGIWKIDVSKQKDKLEPEKKEKVSKLEDEEKDKLWLTVDSRFYEFDSLGKLKLSWVEDGAFYQKVGEWKLSEDSKVLTLDFPDKTLSYKIQVSGKGMTLDPVEKTEEYFTTLYLISLF